MCRHLRNMKGICAREVKAFFVYWSLVSSMKHKKRIHHTQNISTHKTHIYYIYIYRKISGKQYFCSMLAGSNVEQHNDVQ
jgi:hypothetical protein